MVILFLNGSSYLSVVVFSETVKTISELQALYQSVHSRRHLLTICLECVHFGREDALGASDLVNCAIGGQ